MSASDLETMAAILEQPNAYYLNIHTNERAAGALRAQVGNVRTRLGETPAGGGDVGEVPGEEDEADDTGLRRAPGQVTGSAPPYTFRGR